MKFDARKAGPEAELSSSNIISQFFYGHSWLQQDEQKLRFKPDHDNVPIFLEDYFTCWHRSLPFLLAH